MDPDDPQRERHAVGQPSDRLGHDLRYSLDDRLLRGLGYQPRHTFDDGLAETVEWYRAHRVDDARPEAAR